MARADTLSKLYAKTGTALEFNYDLLTAPPLLSLIPKRDMDYLYKILTSVRYNSKMDFKEAEAKKVLEYNGFKRLHAGTHRVAWRHLEYPTIILKVSMNKSSLMDNIREYQNQFFLKPFCTKVFETTPDGLLGLFERVDPIQSEEEYKSVASDIFDFLNEKIIGKYIVDDIGTKSFMNIGLRSVKTCGYAFGPVLLDFPEVYPLDGSKLYCNAVKNGIYCGGEIDYDDGFNVIRCTKCGRTYEARELRKAEENNEIIKEGASKNMRVILKRGEEVVDVIDSRKTAVDVIQKPESHTNHNKRKVVGRKPFALKKYEQQQKKQQKRYDNNSGDQNSVAPSSNAKYYGTSNENATTSVREKIEEAAKVEVNADTGFIPKPEEKVQEAAVIVEQPAEEAPKEERVEINVDALKTSMMSVSKEDMSDEYMKKMDEMENENEEKGEQDMDITINPAAIAAAAEEEINNSKNNEDSVDTEAEEKEDEEFVPKQPVNPLLN